MQSVVMRGEEVARVLVEAGADPSEEDEMGEEPWEGWSG
jgi:hypothetical protein